MAGTEQDEFQPIEVVFNCIICNATIPDVYGDQEPDQALRGAQNEDSQRAFTKMWLGDCTHFFCGKHLEGGGVFSQGPLATGKN